MEEGNGFMKIALNKDIVRTIWKEKKRFISIMLITTLGVTMMTGLAAGCRDLRYSADKFYDEQELFDISILSTLGLTQEDVAALEAMEMVDEAEGAYSEIVHTKKGEQNKTAEVKMLRADGLNIPYLVEGRLPEKTDEIVVTRNYIAETGKQIGDTLEIEELLEDEEEDGVNEESEDADANTEENQNEGSDTEDVEKVNADGDNNIEDIEKEGSNLDSEEEEKDSLDSELDMEEEEEPNFSNTTFIITGVVIDVMDINNAEGSAAFRATPNADYTFFVIPEAIDSEVYTAVYLSLEGTDELLCYSESYEEKTATVISSIEKEIMEQREQARYDEITGEAYDKISEKEEEMYEEFAEIEEEFADAEEEINDGWKELADGRQELADAEKETNDTIAEARQELADGYQQLWEGWDQLNQAEKQLNIGEAQLAEARDELIQQEESTRKQIAEGEALLADKNSENEAAKSQLEGQIANVVKGFGSLWPQAEWEASVAAAQNVLLPILREQMSAGAGSGDTSGQQQMMEEALMQDAGVVQSQQAFLGKLNENLTAALTEIDTQKATLETNLTAVETGITNLTSQQEMLESQKTALTGEIETLQAEKVELEEKLAELEEQGTDTEALQAEKAELEEKLAELEAQWTAMEALQAEKTALEEKLAELTAQGTDTEALQAEKTELEEKLAELAAQGIDLESLQEEKTRLEERLAELAAQGTATEAEIEALKTQINDKNDQITQKQEQLTAIETQLTQMSVQLTELEEQKGELTGYLSQMDTQKAALEAQMTQLSDLLQLAVGKAQVDSAAIALQEAIANLQAQKEYAESQFAAGWAQMAAAEQELTEGREQLSAGRGEVIENLDKLEEGIVELDKNEQEAKETFAEKWQELAEGEQELLDGQEELEENRLEYEEEKAKAEDKIAEAKAEVADIDMTQWYVQDRTSLSGYVNVQSDTDSIESLASVFTVVFFIVAILISLTTVTRMVEEERGLIGTYKALGFTDHEIRKKYVIYALVASFVGGLLGDIGGFIILPEILFIFFDVMYLFPAYFLQFDFFRGTIAVVLFIIGIVGAAVWACHAELKHLPAHLMRPKAPKLGSRVFLEYITPLWKHLSFLNKVTARNLFRYKKRLLMTVFGIMGCTALLLFGFAIKDSVEALMPMQYEEVYKYDLLAATSAEDNDNLLNYMENSEEISEYLNIQVESVKLKNTEGDTEKVQIIVFPSDASITEYVTLTNTGGQSVTLAEEGIYLTENAARMLQVSKGDTVFIQKLNLLQEDTVIADLVKNYLGNNIYMSQKAYEKLFEVYEPNGILANLSDSCTGAKQIAFSDTLSQEDWILSSVSTEDLKEGFSAAFTLINIVVYVVLFLAAGLAFVVLFTLASVNISERIRELATIKVLGFHDREVHLYVNKETMILTSLGILLGLPLGTALSSMLTDILNMPSIYFAVTIFNRSYFLSAGIALVFAVLVQFLTDRTLDVIDPVEALKSVE